MIDLKRNWKTKLPVPATGIRTRTNSIYSSDRDFKISRSKFNDYLTCPRCFYLDRVKGLEPPGMPSFTLNSLTDELLKKEFDKCRKEQKPHPIFEKNNLGHLVPFEHHDLDLWRDSLRHGLKARFKDTNIILSGGIDDVWQNTKTQNLIVVDYKSQAKKSLVEQISYLSDPYHKNYKIQMDFYAYLLDQMGFKVEPISYFLVCNALHNDEGFFGRMNFSQTLIPYKVNTDWIEDEVNGMIEVLNSKEVPDPNPCCKNCAYVNQAKKIYQ